MRASVSDFFLQRIQILFFFFGGGWLGEGARVRVSEYLT